jgi:membrane associated rhomboid family serine protease
VTPWVLRLIVANIIVYFLQQTIPSLTSQLAFYPYPAWFLTHPWTMVTYMFVHASGLWHIGFNMLTLYFFGPRVEQRIGSERFFVLYFFSGICGALLSFLFNDRAAIIGASGAIFGVMFAYAKFWPRDQVLLWGVVPIEVRWLVGISTLISLFGIGQGVAHFAHLGGFAGGYLYLLFLDRRHGAKRFRTQVTNAAPAADALANKWNKVDRTKVHEVNRDEVNRILDKISASGLKSLSPQERLFLMNFVPPDDRPKDPPPVS